MKLFPEENVVPIKAWSATCLLSISRRNSTTSKLNIYTVGFPLPFFLSQPWDTARPPSSPNQSLVSAFLKSHHSCRQIFLLLSFPSLFFLYHLRAIACSISVIFVPQPVLPLTTFSACSSSIMTKSACKLSISHLESKSNLRVLAKHLAVTHLITPLHKCRLLILFSASLKKKTIKKTKSRRCFGPS